MKITPLDIRHREFKRGLRGYVDVEVDEFLDEVADEFERLFKENIELTERLEALNEKVAGYKRIEDALQKTLVSAQSSAEEVKQTASKTAQLMLHEAELKARQLMNESYSERQAVEHATAKLRNAEQEFRFKFRQMLQTYLKQAEEPLVSKTRGDGTSDTQVELARQAEAIRAAIEREEVKAPGSGSGEASGASSVEQGALLAEQGAAPAEEEDEQKADAPPFAAQVEPLPETESEGEMGEGASTDQGSEPAREGAAGEASVESERNDRILFGERDDLLADVDGGVTENEFKW